jgi:hemolysin III
MTNDTPGTEQPPRSVAGSYPHKPRMRGWSHAVAAIAALGVTIGLMLQTHDDMVRFVSVLIFGLSMILLYGFSAVYHIGPWQGRRHAVLRAIDHANIFLLIAGTYTPISVIVLSGPLRVAVLSIIWTLAIAGALSTVLMLRLPRWLTTTLYIGMGWISVITLPTLLTRLPWQALLTFLAGGVLYTIGGIVYALRKPNPLPRVFGFHEVFHLFTIAAGAAFIVAIWVWVVPFSLV